MLHTVIIDYQNKLPIYLQIVDQIKEHVALGILHPKDQLPSIRELASFLGINPNTVKKAYEILESEGIIRSLSTKGCFISEDISSVLEEEITKRIKKLDDEIQELEKLGIYRKEVLKRLEEGK